MTQAPRQPEVPPAPRPVSWMSLLRTVRAPLSVIVLAGIAVVLPPQSRDTLAALGDGDVVLSETVIFYLALAFLTFSGWYWSRALISARFDVPYTDEGRAKLAATETRLERAFEQAWDKEWTGEPRARFKERFLSLFYDDKQALRRGMPLWIAAGRDALEQPAAGSRRGPAGLAFPAAPGADRRALQCAGRAFGGAAARRQGRLRNQLRPLHAARARQPRRAAELGPLGRHRVIPTAGLEGQRDQHTDKYCRAGTLGRKKHSPPAS